MAISLSQPAGFDNSDGKGIPPNFRDRASNGAEKQPSPERSDRPIRVLIADDHVFVRQGLRAVLATHPGYFEICAEAATGLDAVQKARESKPDVAVIDVSMPGLNGLEATRMIVKDVPKAEVLILTMHESEQLIEGVLNAGARGYLLKTDVARDLPLAIESLYKQRPFFSSKIARGVLDGYLKASAGKGTGNFSLTPAERRIVQLLAEGKSNKEVANAHGISVKTVETHRANIMRKLGMRSMSDLVHYAVRNEIIQP
jgi:DNA-binding NarL/FixJ family response regulator